MLVLYIVSMEDVNHQEEVNSDKDISFRTSSEDEEWNDENYFDNWDLSAVFLSYTFFQIYIPWGLGNFFSNGRCKFMF